MAEKDGFKQVPNSGATQEEMKNGYHNALVSMEPDEAWMRDLEPAPGGFLGRSKGWER